jgi:rhodanese-related sulfurtransferase
LGKKLVVDFIIFLYLCTTKPTVMLRLILTTTILFLATISLFAQFNSVGAEHFEKQIIATKGEQLIDVRTPQEFRENRIANAQNMDYRNANFRHQIEQLDKNKPVLIYCQRGVRSRSALEIFKEAGFKTVYDLEGGIVAWLQAGKPIEQ